MKKTIQELIVELHNLYLKRYVEKDTEMKTDKSKHKFCLDYMNGSKIKEKNVYHWCNTKNQGNSKCCL